MNFLTRAVESLTGQSIPYSLKDRVVDDVSIDPVRSKSIWSVYNAEANKDGAKVSVFEFDLRNPALARYVQLARNAFKKSRSLALLPGVVNTVDSIQNDNYLYIVTERVRPLSDVLSVDYPEEAFPRDFSLLGLFQIANALKFINVEGSSVHCNVCPDSVFVTESGEWKLAGFELLVSTKDQDYTILSSAYNLPSFHDAANPPEFEKSGASCLSNTSRPQYAAKFDSYKYGALAYELLSGEPINRGNPLASDFSAIPQNMVPHLKKCLHPSVTIRYTLEQFLKFGRSSFFATPLINFWQALSELALKDADEKLEIFQSLDELGTLPVGMFEHQILPDLIASFQTIANNENNQRALLLLILLKNKVSDEAFQALVKPAIFNAFTLPDRAIRMTLLSGLQEIVSRLSNHEVQDKIYPNLVQGFNDTNASIRESTIKSIIPIVDKISDRQLNNDLLRYMARLQNDESAAIRTNVIVCLTKVAEHMNSNSRVAVLTTAFSKALKDSFVPTRLNTVMAFKTCAQYFSAEVCCSRVLSALAPALLDASSKVRKEAKAAIDLYLKKIMEEASKLPADDEQTMQQEQEETDNLVGGFKTLSLTDVALGAKKTLFGFGNTGSSASLAMRETSPSARPSSSLPASSRSSFNHPRSSKNTMLNLDTALDDDDDDDDGWGDFDDVTAQPSPAKTVTSRFTSKPQPKSLQLKKSKLDLERAMKDEEEDDGDAWGDDW